VKYITTIACSFILTLSACGGGNGSSDGDDVTPPGDDATQPGDRQIVIEESAEGSGWEYPWTEQSTQCGPDPLDEEEEICNLINPDAQTAMVPLTCAPLHWGDEMIVIWAQVPHREALVRTELSYPVPDSIMSLEFAVLTDELTPDTYTLVAAAKDGHGPEVDELAAWTVHLFGSDSATHKVRIGVAGETAELFIDSCQPLSLTIEYYASEGRAFVFADGDPVLETEIMPDHAQEIAWVVIGNSNSSTGHGSVVAVDEVTFTGW
jgi:hypothetical protein